MPHVPIQYERPLGLRIGETAGEVTLHSYQTCRRYRPVPVAIASTRSDRCGAGVARSRGPLHVAVLGHWHPCPAGLIPRPARRCWPRLSFITRAARGRVARLQEAYRASVNMREQKVYREYLTRLRSKDSELLHTPDRDGTGGPLERGFTSVTNPTDFKGLVIGSTVSIRTS